MCTSLNPEIFFCAAVQSERGPRNSTKLRAIEMYTPPITTSPHSTSSFSPVATSVSSTTSFPLTPNTTFPLTPNTTLSFPLTPNTTLSPRQPILPLTPSSLPLYPNLPPLPMPFGYHLSNLFLPHLAPYLPLNLSPMYNPYHLGSLPISSLYQMPQLQSGTLFVSY